MQDADHLLYIQADLDKTILQLIRSDTTSIQFQITDDTVIRTMYFDWAPDGIVVEFPIKFLRQDQVDWIRHLIKTRRIRHDDSD